MAVQLTNEEIKELCSFIAESANEYNMHMGAAFQMLLNTGCRVGELDTFSRLMLTGTGSVGLVTQKSNYIRVIDSSYIPSLFYYNLANGIQQEYFVSPAMIKAFMRNRLPYVRLTNGDKDILTHLYRHNRVRTLYGAGWSIGAIGQFMGQMSNSTVYNYLNDPIYAHSL